MMFFRKSTILVHRYLGIAVSLLFVVWFVSGIAMIYARGMPTLTRELRLEHLPPLDLTRIRLTPAEAEEIAELGREPTRLLLLTIQDRPAYRFFVNQEPVTIFSDTGELHDQTGPAVALSIASRFAGLPEAKLQHVATLDEADQWTFGYRRQMPLYKVAVDDDARTHLYVSEPFSEVVLMTTRGSRALAWIAAIPHWLYFAPLRANDGLWRQVILWTSGLGTIGAFIGLVLAFTQFGPSKPFRWSRVGASIPYAGWMRWHYMAGVIFGVFAVTWAFSGMLSIEPWFWASTEGTGRGIRQALAGGPLEPSLYSAIDGAKWNEALRGRAAKEVEFVRLQGDPYYVVDGVDSKPLLVAARSFEVRREPFSVESVVQRVKEGNPNVPVADLQLRSDYDSYYRSRDRRPPLPVLQVKFDDPDATWFYIDPATSQIITRYTRRERVQRWIYNGLHSLDFPFWYDSPLWDVGVVVLCLGGATLSAIGVVIGFKRLTRGAKRRARPRAAA